MKCPHCDKEIPGSPCTECGGINPEEANYCMDCGLSLKEQVEDAIEQDDALDLDDRVLCPDGTCTGIMVNGRCTECGKTLGDDKDSEN
ncbi:MAG: zinc ribbon domain-containing protein [Desulfobacteraceae bacterium]|nr:zinc ribbon domain-containing protein [Desulfobacteraceae bacterium]